MHFCLSKSSIECLTSSRCSIIVCGREVAIFKEHFSHPHELLLVPPLPSLPSFRSEYVLSKAPRLLSIGGGVSFQKLPLYQWLPNSFVLTPPDSRPASPSSGSLGTVFGEGKCEVEDIFSKQCGCSSVTFFLAGLPSVHKSRAGASDFPAAVIWWWSRAVPSAEVLVWNGVRGTLGLGIWGQARAWKREGICGIRSEMLWWQWWWGDHANNAVVQGWWESHPLVGHLGLQFLQIAFTFNPKLTIV